MIYLDTHVAAWLHASGGAALSPTAAELIDGSDDIRISPMVRLELQYLFEIGRVGAPAAVVVDHLTAALGMRVCDAPFVAVAHQAENLTWTRDPFDRLVVAQAGLHEARLITKDGTMQANYAGAVW